MSFRHHIFVLLPIFVFFLLTTLCDAFSFQVSNPTQCDDLTVSWQGGQPPFQLDIIPPGGTIRNISIPSGAFQQNQGMFSTLLELPSAQTVFFAMSDATGVTAGGMSRIMTVGRSISGNSCNTTDPGVDFVFSADNGVGQCQPYEFTRYSGAIQPISILVWIPAPQEDSFYLSPPTDDSFTWIANATAGSSIMFSMTDSKGRIGGTSSIFIVKGSDDASCLTTSSSSVASSGTIAPSQTPSPSQSSSPGARSSNIGTIVGGSVGGVAGIALVALLVYMCFFRRKRQRVSRNIDLTYDPSGSPVPEQDTFLHSGQYSATPFLSDTPRQSMPLSADGSSTMRYSGGPVSYARQSLANPGDSDPSSEKNSRGRLTVSNGPTSPVESTSTSRVIVHTDITESEPIELPPQYSDSRAPIPEILSYGQNPSPGSTSSNSRAHLINGNTEKS
ncbi:hypothetical protein BDQ17DRAFT_1346915 [Cyathus striatus]|nr:hypothetical protein BDQ17DRAFT_1346915 [Cyathus striatus]